jgi:hypothetical protein
MFIDKSIFKEELKDAEELYRKNLVELEHQICGIMPSLIYYMKNFIEAHTAKDDYIEKLEALLIKTGKKQPNEGKYD